ncbi:XRE family transcriptional regulator [Actinoalloteichus sp. AHMU CJ021]|uniref:Transcriptional regulator, contains XRE-family HTH domain n=2 Tax=Actinoalloteichus cyanogriseus TaxID=2893586 RepID=A0ABT1JCC8_ACTCY|nr:XRE family transcriptional regulator [Actinoalloteichus sp. AHMU CJ021]MCP2330147.1 Transcriptional regulator, contains XRE-family HTH domain [Actinoalloteichus caeruleus DSM 43889]
MNDIEAWLTTLWCMARTNLTPLSRALGDAIRKQRTASGLTVRALADKMGLRHTAIVRLEGGTRRAPLDELAALLGTVGTPPDERDRIMAMARDVDRDTWSTSGGSGATAQLATLVRYEREAIALTEANALLVPGLLQVEPYIRSVMEGLPPDVIDARTYYRIGRQQILTRAEPPKMLALIDEAVLARTIGGPAVMAHQMDHLVSLVDAGNVEVRVIPLAAGSAAMMASGWMLVELPDGPPVVHLDHAQAGTMLHTRRDVAAFEQARDTIIAATLNPEASRQMITRYAQSYRSTQSEE